MTKGKNFKVGYYTVDENDEETGFYLDPEAEQIIEEVVGNIIG